MTTYGYRLFRVQLRQGSKRKDLPFVQGEGNSAFYYADHFVDLLTRMKGLRQHASPRPVPADLDAETTDEEEEGAPKQPVFSIVQVERRGAHPVFTVRYGRDSGYDLAQAGPDDEVDDVRIKDLAVTREYRGALLLPETGVHGVLALETVGRACPNEPIRKWAREWSRERASSTPLDGDASRPSWWTLRLEALADDARRADFATNAAAQTVILRRLVLGRAGRPDSHDVQLEVSLEHHAALRRRIERERTRWWRRFDQKRPVTRDEGAARIAAILASAADTEDTSVDYDDVSLVLDDGTERRRVTPLNFPDVFTYKIQEDVSPSVDELYARLRGSVERVATAAELSSIDWSGWPTGRG